MTAYDTDASRYPAAALFLNQAVPTFGPNVEPTSPIDKAAQKYPLGWWPPLGSVLASLPALILHATWPVGGTVLCGLISAGSFAVAVLDAKDAGEATAARDALVVSIAAGFEAAACAEGGAVAVSLGIFGLLIGIGSVVPRWFAVRSEARKHRRRIEEKRMHEQYLTHRQALAHAARLAEVHETLAPFARNALGTVERIEDHVNELIAGAGMGELTAEVKAFLRLQAERQQAALEAAPVLAEIAPAARVAVDDGWDAVANILGHVRR